MSERTVTATDGQVWTADEFAYIQGWQFEEAEFIDILTTHFHVVGYERRWELMNLRESGMFSAHAYPEGWDINQGRPGT